MRPQITGGLLQSTEFSNIVGIIFILGMILLSDKTIGQRVKSLFIAINILLAILLFNLFSTGTIVGLIILFVMFFLIEHPPKSLSSIFRLAGILLVFFILFRYIAAHENIWDILSDFSQYKSDDAIRAFTYDYLWQNIQSNILWGNGFNSTVNNIHLYPHQNILGLWSEGGFLALIAYLLFLGISIVAYIRHGYNWFREKVTGGDLLYLRFCIYILLFLHFKGLIEDTYYEKIVFILTGSAMGYLLMTKNSKGLLHHDEIV
jgi:O-antigen ligase